MTPTVLYLTEPPPSVNKLFANVSGKGRVKTKDYAQWIRATGWEVKAQGKPPVLGKVIVDITIRRMSVRADIDNRIKAILDLLVSVHMIDDDQHVEEVRARWGGTVGCRIVIAPANQSLEVAA